MTEPERMTLIEYDPEEPPRDKSYSPWLAISAAFVLLWGCTAEASNGNFLKSFCETEDAYIQNGCAGYIVGLLDGLIWEQQRAGFEQNASPYFCIPSGVDHEQVQDVIIGYIDNNPADRHLPTPVIGALALSEAFPCQ